jgi:hypothetical protein
MPGAATAGEPGLVLIIVLILVVIGRIQEARPRSYSVSEVAGGSILLRSLSVPLMVSTTAR